MRCPQLSPRCQTTSSAPINTGIIHPRLPPYPTTLVSSIIASRGGNTSSSTFVQTDSAVPTFQTRSKIPRETNELTEDELVLTSPIVYGFSLADKTWRESSFSFLFLHGLQLSEHTQSSSTSSTSSRSSGTTQRSRISSCLRTVRLSFNL